MTRLIVVCVMAGLVVPVDAGGPPAVPRSGRQQPPAPAAVASQPAPSQDYLFPSGAGLFFFHVKPDKTAQFEAVAAKIGEALDKTQDPARKQQAASWRIYKSAEAVKEDAIYLFFFDPAVANADYDPVRVLGEGAPTEVQTLYERLKDAVIRVERMGLTKMR